MVFSIVRELLSASAGRFTYAFLKVKKESTSSVELIMYFSYDSIYPHASIVSDELDFDELFDLSDKVTKEVYTEEFPFVVTATNRG